MLEMNTKKATGGRRSTSPKSKRKIASKASTGKEGKDKENHKFKDFKDRSRKGDPMPTFNEHEIRLNKFLSNAGVASRREADVLIQSGIISVNNVVVMELGYKIKPGDIVKYDDETISAEKKRYVLLNKPKGFITTTDDPMGRKTVMSLIYKACKEMIYPVGKLDRETTGLLLFTNDGDLIKKLTHPRYKASNIYHVETDKPVNSDDLIKLTTGIYIGDEKIVCKNAEYVKGGNSREIGIELHSGKNKIIKRLMEALDYQTVKIDRVRFAGLTKKDLPRGFFRHLTEKEVAFLKMS